MKLNDKERQLLQDIMNDKFSVGAFCGMVTNLTLTNQTEGQTIRTPESIIKKALQIRLIAQEMTQKDSVMSGQSPTDTLKEPVKPVDEELGGF